MKSADTVPRGGVDLSDLKALVDGGPFLTVYLPTESTVENAAHKSQAHWKSLRRELADSGAPEAALDLVDPLVAEAHLHGQTLAVVADEQQVHIQEHLSEELQPRGSWAPVADIVPIIKARQERIPYVTVWADHGGADIAAHLPSGRVIEKTTGDGEPMQKVAPGGWSQQRYQQRVENDWSSNATDAANEVRKLAEKVGARITIVGGDVKAINMIAEQLPRELPVALIDHGRANDGSAQTRDNEVRTMVRTAVAEDTVAILEKFKEEKGQNDLAVEGRNATADALTRAAVELLLVPDDRDLFGGDSTVVDALVRDAIATGASVRIIPTAGPVNGEVGAILRFV